MKIKKVFFDINIVADIIDSSRATHGEAVKLLQFCIQNDIEVCISEDMLSTLFYISKNREKTLKFFNNVVMIDWTVLPFGNDVITDAIEFSLNKKLDLEDLLQCFCAKRNGCDILITNDKSFYDCQMEIGSCKEFLKKELY